MSEDKTTKIAGDFIKEHDKLPLSKIVEQILANNLKLEIINTLRKDRKSFKKNNIDSVRKCFVEKLDFDATNKNRTDLSKLLFNSYKELETDEIFHERIRDNKLKYMLL